MKAEEKAKELVDKFNPYADQLFMDDDHYSYDDEYRREQNAKQCALICVDELIDELNEINTYSYMKSEKITGRILYLKAVKEHIKQM